MSAEWARRMLETARPSARKRPHRAYVFDTIDSETGRYGHVVYQVPAETPPMAEDRISVVDVALRWVILWEDGTIETHRR